MIKLEAGCNDLAAQSRDFARIERAIRFLAEHRSRQPALAEVAASVSLSEFHLQRLFSRWAGISPKRFLQYLTKEDALRRLRASASVLDAALGAGLSGPGRLHDLLLECDAVTPGAVRRGGEDLVIRYGFHPTPFGDCLVGTTPRGICALRFPDDSGRDALIDELRHDWPRARLIPDAPATSRLAHRAFAGLPNTDLPLRLHLRGTNFQIKVWEALLAIPEGALATYSRIARAIGRASASRAVAGAIASNPIALLIPCHRVLRSSGDIGGYRWGVARKQGILALEAARTAG